MTQTIAIVNEKGGTGKTTTAVNLSAALGELGKKILLVDLDGQAASSRWLGVEDDTRFADALWAGEAFEPIPEAMPGVALAPGSGKLDSVAHDLRPTQGGQLRKVLQLLPAFDYIIIDCPPSLGNRLIGNALLAATHAIVPVEASILALDGLRILLTTFQDVRDGFGHDIALRGVLTCRYDARTRLSRLVLAELQRALPGRVFHTVIRENVRIRECPGSGKSILAYAPDCHAAEDYRLLAKEMLAPPAQQTSFDGVEATGLENELSEEERQAVADLRGQVNALFRAQEAKAPAPEGQAVAVSAPTAAAAPGPQQQEPDGAPAASAPAQGGMPERPVRVALDPELASQVPLQGSAGAAEDWEQGVSGQVGAVGPVGECTDEEPEHEVELPARASEQGRGDESEGDPLPPPDDEKAKMAALRAVLHKLSQQTASEAQDEERRLPSWRRFFSKRSA